MEFFQYPIAFLISIGILVSVHEFGHFWAARRVGVRVERFSVGFGPVLWRRKDRLGTEFCVSAVPLGGYVKLLDQRVEPVADQDLPFEFSNKSAWARIFVYAAGPLINFLFAVLVYWLLFSLGVVQLAPIIGEVTPGSYADQAGLVAGDEILAVDDQAVKGWETLSYALVSGVGDANDIRFKIKPAQSELVLQRSVSLEHYRLDSNADPVSAFGVTPGGPAFPAVVGSISANSVAQSIGLKAGDKFLEVNGETIADWRALVQAITPKADQPVQLLIQRKAQQLRFDAIPSPVEREDGEIVGRLGVGPKVQDHDPQWVRMYHYGPIEALIKGFAHTWELSALILVSIQKMALGYISLDNLSGPITIAQVAGDSVSYGMEPFLTFLAYLSVSLGVLNLLPIPMLDGGHILYTLIEMIIRRPLPMRAQQLGLGVGISLIAVFMLVAFYNDLTRLIN